MLSSRVTLTNRVLPDIATLHLKSWPALNATACLSTRMHQCNHITETMCDELHWLPISYWIQYMIRLFVYNCLHHHFDTGFLIGLCKPQSTMGVICVWQVTMTSTFLQWQLDNVAQQVMLLLDQLFWTAYHLASTTTSSQVRTELKTMLLEAYPHGWVCDSSAHKGRETNCCYNNNYNQYCNLYWTFS